MVYLRCSNYLFCFYVVCHTELLRLLYAVSVKVKLTEDREQAESWVT